MVVFHIDLNAFFASAEMVRNPSLRGKPVVVSGKGRKGIVTTASYEARSLGITSAMPVFEALKRCPELVVVDVDFALYEDLSSKFIGLIRRYSPLVEQASIDECYADMTQAITKFAKPLDLAVDIQETLQKEYGLTCSIGIAPNKFLAKIASDFKKPCGITVLRKREVETKLWPLSIDAIGGIGKKTSPLLKEKGIYVIGDLVKDENRDVIYSILGKNAPIYIAYAQGEDDSRIVGEHAMISMSQSTTLEKDVEDYDTVKQVFSSLTKRLCGRLLAEEQCGDTVSITIRYYDFQTITRSKRLDHEIASYDEMIAEVMLLFDLHDKQLPIRHLGVGLSNLKNSMVRNQMNLFQWIEMTKQEEKQKTQSQKEQSTEHVIASLNERLRENSPHALKKLSDLVKKEPSTGFRGIFKK